MGPLLVMFGERPFADCKEKVDGNFVVGFGSGLDRCYGELVPLLLDYSILYPEILM
jgi:hypothetical protein